CCRVSWYTSALLRSLFASWMLVTGASDACVVSAHEPGQKSPQAVAAEAVVVVQDFGAGLSHVRAANPDVRLNVGHDSALPGERVLLVEYPLPGSDPAARDVWCDAEHRDWSGGRAISFQIKPDNAIRLSISFFDRNRVAYTFWTELQGGVWQTV